MGRELLLCFPWRVGRVIELWMHLLSCNNGMDGRITSHKLRVGVVVMSEQAVGELGVL